MSCARSSRALQAYLDGEVDEATARRVTSHLNGCRDCGLEADLYREIKSALARQQQPDPRAVERLYTFAESLLHTGSDPGDGGDRAPGG
ncbi:anti-sigma factor family protein [Streptomyces echinoruber]|uniref:Putative zinc-finger domain-containing protein n=1 Tax=Streptomyces echinoruber TaxID=68898 RepID=A0A918RGT7_9ACTN|nr:zf-HC2 domain-containing protein [Streptomyces echinoruber]GGZ97518.1 hypothetical protein GCM10010389_40900 [Streptomyces echinoruber]